MKCEFPSEKAIEDYVWSKLAKGECCPIADERYDLCFRQKEIKGYGVTDIIKISVVNDEVTITVLELKNEAIKEAHISQLCRYIKGVRRVVDLYKRKVKDCPFIEVRGEIAGPFNQDRGDIVWLADQLDDIQIFSLEVDFEKGFVSSRVGRGWYRNNENRLAYKDVVRDIALAVKESKNMVEQEYIEYLECVNGNVVNIKGDHDA